MFSLNDIVGANGTISSSILSIPETDHYLFAVGSVIVVRSYSDPSYKQFLHGHDGPVTCFSISPSGRFLVSGQEASPGFVADAIVWNLCDFSLLERLSLHKVKVESVTFSTNEQYIATMGGLDDNYIALWEVSSAAITAVASSAIGRFPQSIVKALASSDNITFLTAGKEQMLVWKFDSKLRRFSNEPIAMGHVRRNIISLDISADGETCFAGTSTGDILEISIPTMRFKGVKSICTLRFDEKALVLTGTGDGIVSLQQRVARKITKKIPGKPVPPSISFASTAEATVIGSVNGMSILKQNGDVSQVLLLTDKSNCYLATISYGKDHKIDTKLLFTAHPTAVVDGCFPSVLPEYGIIFLTAGGEDLRLWTNLEEKSSYGCMFKERLRVCCPGVNVLACCLSPNGDAILSGWDDGNVRVFGPESGKLMFSIQNAHKASIPAGKQLRTAGVSSICCNHEYIVTGGIDSLVRVWSFSSNPELVISFKEHRSGIQHLSIHDSFVLSASSDGSISVFDLDEMKKVGSLSAPTFFHATTINEDSTQGVSVSSDGEVRYWDLVAFEELRSVSLGQETTSIALSGGDILLAVGHSSGKITILNYETAEVVEELSLLSGQVSALHFSPDSSKLMATSTDCGVVIFNIDF
ncbi:hypothetical protein GEMRC1_005961 [Eukaryota sp. GEM-RC1]